MTKSLSISSLSFLILASCSGGGSSSSPGNNPGGPLDHCNGVVTDSKINKFNQSQSAFSVTYSGASMYCKEEITENGRTRKVEVTGYSQVRIRPGLRYLRTEMSSRNKGFLLITEKIVPTEDDAKNILRQMGLPFISGASPNYSIDQSYTPAFIRFEKGALFYVFQEQTRTEGEKPIYVFEVLADDGQSQTLDRKMHEFLSDKVNLEILWYPRQGHIAMLSTDKTQQEMAWNDLLALDVLVSLVRDNAGASDQVVARAIQNVGNWDLDALLVHSRLPELYTFALNEWRHPSIADNTISNLLAQLRYIVKIDPTSRLKEVLIAHDTIAKFNGGYTESLRLAVDYTSGKSWSKEQFELLVEVSEELYDSFGSRTWPLATALTQKTKFDKTPSLFAAKVASLLKSRSLLTDSLPTTATERVFAKINAGLTPANISFYFDTFDFFSSELNARGGDAEMACDELILSGKLTKQNNSAYTSLFLWMKSTTYSNFTEAYAVAKSLSQNGDLTEAKVSLFKEVYAWLTGTMYLNKSTALSKSAEYLGLQAHQITAIKDLTTWYIGEIYLNRSVALDRAESLVIEKQIAPEQLQVMKDIVLWLISDIYINRTTAASRGESYVTSALPLTAERSALLKSYTLWLVTEIYLNRSTALEKGENFIISLSFDKVQIEAMKSAVNWLISDLYLNRTTALAKGEDYLTQGHLTPALLSALKQEYNAQLQLRKPKSEALKIAEKKILNLN